MGNGNTYLQKSVEANLRATQLKILDILLLFDGICRKYGLRYWLDGGTLLGAVRHQGFIPWDDDLDVGMPSEDLRRFLEVASQEIPTHIELQTRKNAGGYFYCVRLYDKNSFLLGKDGIHDVAFSGICLEIFEFISYPSFALKLVKHITRKICISKIYFNALHRITGSSCVKYFFFRIRYGVYWLIWWILTFLRGGKYISNVPYNNVYGIVHRVRDIYPLSEIGFEGHAFNCPANPDGYLTDLYRNYMQLPPEEKQKPTHTLYVNPSLSNESTFSEYL